MKSRVVVSSAILLSLAGGEGWSKPPKIETEVALSVSAISREQIESLPETRDLLLAIQAIPGVQVQRVNVDLDKKALRGLEVRGLEGSWAHDGLGGFSGPGRQQVFIDMRLVDVQIPQRIKIEVDYGDAIWRQPVPVEQWPNFRPDIKIDTWDGLPDRVTPGETLWITPPDLKLPLGRLRLENRFRYELDGMRLNPEPPIILRSLDPLLRRNPRGVGLQLPLDLKISEFNRFRIYDPWGQPLVHYDWRPEIIEPIDRDSPDQGRDLVPSIDQTSQWIVPGGSACVCGTFPSPEAWTGIELGGRTLSPTAASSSVVEFEVPADLPPGSYDWGFSDDFSKGSGKEPKPTDGQRSTALGVRGTIDENTLWRGESTPVTFYVTGTDRPFPMKIENLSPSIISLAGGNSQFKPTCGGADNKISDQVTGVKVGSFDINYSINTGDCPCVPANDNEVKAADREFSKVLDILLSDGPPAGSSTAAGCQPTEPSCLMGDRFKVDVKWTDPKLMGADVRGSYNRLEDGELFYFNSASTETVIKIFDACSNFDSFWVFGAGKDAGEYRLTVTDTQTGGLKQYLNPLGSGFDAIMDTEAFATCP